MSLLTSAVSLLGHMLPATRANRLLILIYHRVHAKPDPMFPGEVDAERFDWQMGLLRRYCHPMPLADGVAGLRAGKLPPRAVAITFDDGYADNVTVALPILLRHGIKATFFIATGFLDGGRMWNDSIIEAIRRAQHGQLDLSDLGLGVVTLGAESARGAIAEAIIRKVKHLPPAERQRRVEELCFRIGQDLPSDLMLTSGQVRQLVEAGMEVGAHTITHPILRMLPDEEARAEIGGSRECLERIVGRPVRMFAYPNGRPGIDYCARDRNLVADAGFVCALATIPRVCRQGVDYFQLPRRTPWRRTAPSWFIELLAAFAAAGPRRDSHL